MELRLTLLILVPLGLVAAAVYVYGLRPLWKRALERCETLDERDDREARLRKEAERELHGDAPR